MNAAAQPVTCQDRRWKGVVKTQKCIVIPKALLCFIIVPAWHFNASHADAPVPTDMSSKDSSSPLSVFIWHGRCIIDKATNQCVHKQRIGWQFCLNYSQAHHQRQCFLLLTGGIKWAAVEKLLWICGRGRPSNGFEATKRQAVTILSFLPCSSTGKRFDALNFIMNWCGWLCTVLHMQRLRPLRLHPLSLDTRITHDEHFEHLYLTRIRLIIMYICTIAPNIYLVSTDFS